MLESVYTMKLQVCVVSLTVRRSFKRGTDTVDRLRSLFSIKTDASVSIASTLWPTASAVLHAVKRRTFKDSTFTIEDNGTSACTPQLSHIHEETNNHGSSLTIHLLGDFYKDIKRVLARVITVQRENTDKQRGAQTELTKIRGALVELLLARFSANTPALFWSRICHNSHRKKGTQVPTWKMLNLTSLHETASKQKPNKSE